MGWRRRDHHRLGRLPGVLDGPRLGGRGDQAPPRPAPARWSSRSRRRACASAPTSTARERFMGPETSMEVQAQLGLGHRAGVRRVHARSTSSATTPRARWSGPTAGSTAASPGAPSTPRRASSCTGSCRAGSTRTCGSSRPPTWRGSGVDGHRDRRLARTGEGADARGGRAGRSRRCPTSRRATCWGSATWTTSSTPWARASTASTARPRPGWRATAPRSCPTPERAGASTWASPPCARAASRSTSAARARPAASTRAATSTT